MRPAGTLAVPLDTANSSLPQDRGGRFAEGTDREQGQVTFSAALETEPLIGHDPEVGPCPQVAGA